MMAAGAYMLLLFTIIAVSINGIQSQLKVSVVDVPDEIVNLLENFTDTCTLPPSSQTHMEETLNLMASTQTQLANALNQSSGTQTSIEQTLNLMASTQNQIADDLHQTRLAAQTPSASTLNHTTDGQHRLEEVLVQISNTLNQSVDTQHRKDKSLVQIADALTHVVGILQTQGEHLHNTTSTMIHIVRKLDAQNLIISQLTADNHVNAIDCSDLVLEGSYPSGSYNIRSWDNLGSFPVYCDTHTDGGGWTVFQRRFDGSVDFYLGWNAYETGFGSPGGEFWLGLRQIHRLTRQGEWILRIDLEDFEGRTAYAEYKSFSVGDTASNYRLSIGAYTGTAGDSLPAARHNNQAFSTKDRDHDNDGVNCAQDRQGAWWYDDCTYSNLNGLYTDHSSDAGMIWYQWKDTLEVLKRSEMKIRRIR